MAWLAVYKDYVIKQVMWVIIVTHGIAIGAVCKCNGNKFCSFFSNNSAYDEFVFCSFCHNCFSSISA